MVPKFNHKSPFEKEAERFDYRDRNQWVTDARCYAAGFEDGRRDKGM